MQSIRRRLIIGGVLVGALALGAAACGSGGSSVQARQAGDTTPTTATTTPGSTTTTAAPATTALPAPTVPPAPVQLPCTAEALGAAYAAKFGSAVGLKPQQCAAGWATSSTAKGFDPPTFTLYRAEGDHWVALNQNGGKLCAGQGVPKDVARQIGCDS